MSLSRCFEGGRAVPVEFDVGPDAFRTGPQVGYGVIGSPTDSGSVSLGSSPSTPAIWSNSQPPLEFRPLQAPVV